MVNPETFPDKNTEAKWGNDLKRSDGRRDRIWTGIFLLLVGAVALARSLQAPLPHWLFSWQTLLIALGIFGGIRNKFEGAGWLIMILVGAAFLVNDSYYNLNLRKQLWPLVLICIGAVFIFRARREKNWWKQKQILQNDEETGSRKREGNFADITVVFGGGQKNFSTPNFAGGDITTIFGGAEVNLTMADIQEPAIIDLTVMFGGIELIVPSDWTIKSNLTSILASVNDKRVFSPSVTENPKKLLILEGTAMFAGIEIKSF